MKCPFACYLFSATLLFSVSCSDQTNEAADVVAPDDSQAAAERDAIMNLGIKMLVHPAENVYSGGQPTSDQLDQLAKLGVKQIINLRPAGEMEWDELTHAEVLGIDYVSIPVAGKEDISVENAKKFVAALEKHKGEISFAHCASGNRIGALMAMHAGKVEGKSSDEAIAIGKQWGMTRLEPAVRELLAGD
ncbi:fused DSP-PTPase phosphatase/NAD kinase-like protein [Persicirhabdus sediminis]|uniref:DSP-PTPase phosphatase fused to NAD+ Kinase domain-containing protein n=1 Tax=Persicirhabdus sediminis TaxID=454144 RepID=A0A8J7MEJ6_9BACT|nr:sulfur transferase domain-containing protein [Persicirhabdus sediminis]MBK1791221.1 hypothetical protein [Persicirhabdus sediminis]